MNRLITSLLFPHKSLNLLKLKSRLNQKTILITGASYGIGEELAYLLAPTGCHLILVGRTVSKLELVKTGVLERGGSAETFGADLRNPEELDSLIIHLQGLKDGIDVFVNNAGISIRRSLEDSLDRYHDFTRTMAINYFAPVRLMLSLIPILKEKNGHVINISTANVLIAAAPKWSAYQASKGAFDGWFRCALPELNAMNIATTSIYLPLVKTRMIEPTESYRNMPAMYPNHVAKIICRYLLTRKRTFKPWWLKPIMLASVLHRGLWESIITKQTIWKKHG